MKFKYGVVFGSCDKRRVSFGGCDIDNKWKFRYNAVLGSFIYIQSDTLRYNYRVVIGSFDKHGVLVSEWYLEA